MKTVLRLLLVENDEDDAVLILRELSQAGFDVQHLRVDTAAGMQRALDSCAWDAIVADYALPRFTGMAALELARLRALDVPFILVSGAIGEEVAVAAMRAGASDYVMKSALARLAPAIRRELGEAQVRAAKRRSEEALRAANQRLQVLSQRVLEIQEAERRDLARELHDEVGQALTAVKIHLQSLFLRSDSLRHVPQIEEAVRIVEDALAQVRGLSLNLRPPQLDDLGLTAALRWFLDRQSRLAGFPIRLDADELSGRLDPVLETACFRIVQEAITNALRHARARRIWVELRFGGGELRLTIGDDGVGFDVAAARRASSGASLGLASLEERATLAGGSVEFRSEPGKGTRVHARFEQAEARAAAGARRGTIAT